MSTYGRCPLTEESVSGSSTVNQSDRRSGEPTSGTSSFLVDAVTSLGPGHCVLARSLLSCHTEMGIHVAPGLFPDGHVRGPSVASVIIVFAVLIDVSFMPFAAASWTFLPMHSHWQPVSALGPDERDADCWVCR